MLKNYLKFDFNLNNNRIEIIKSNFKNFMKYPQFYEKSMLLFPKKNGS